MKLISGFWIAIALVLCSYPSNPQTTTDWIRVQSDDGEFSIEVPIRSAFFANKDGFFDSEINTSNNYHLKEMKMLNAYVQGSLLSFESYEAKKSALDGIYVNDTYFKKGLVEESVIQKPGYRVKQTVAKNNEGVVFRQYFNSKDHIYVLTAASRKEETKEIRRFLDSARLDLQAKVTPDPSAVAFSKLHNADVQVEMQIEKDTDKKNIPVLPPKQADDDKTETKLTLFLKPKAAYIDTARMDNVQGTIKLQLTFSADAYIPKIVILKTLPDGLLRQALFAALRIKFLPKEKNGLPVTVAMTFEYGFNIY